VSGPAALAQHLHRLAVLTAAGLAPAAAWRHVAEAATPPDPVLSSVAAASSDGTDIATAIEHSAALAGLAESSWRSLSAAWRVATVCGAPLAAALRAFAEALRDRDAARRDIEVALAGPRATARIVLLLPFVAVLLALLMGVDLASTIASPIGAACLIVGTLLIVVARRWMRRMLRAAEPRESSDALALDLLAVAASGGGAPEAAAALVTGELERAGTAVDPRHLDALVRLSRRAGAPLGELARTEAAEVRARERTDARAEAERLAVALMIPLGACVLPSFLLLGVVPMLLGLLSSTARVF
jgi:tight adherence protein B